MRFDPHSLEKENSRLNSRARKRVSRVWFVLRLLIIVAMVGIVCVVGFAGVGSFDGILDTAPDIGGIDVTPRGFSTFVYDADGRQTAKLVSTDANRIPVTMDMVPLDLQHAFVSIEDERFYDHKGIDIQGIARAAFVGLSSGHFSEGASTITQQLIKNNVFTGWTSENFSESVRRKIQEQYLAVALEKTMSKDDILLNYMNTINLGHNTLGVQAAAMRYFGRSVSTLSLSECAAIAGITQNPTRYDPIAYPEENNKRRTKVLDNMLEQGYINKKEHDAAIADDVYARIKKVDIETDDNQVNSYFVDALTDQVMKDLQRKGYTEQQAYILLYSGGLHIYSTQDPKIQAICDEEVANPDNFPGGTRWYLNYNLSIEEKDGSVSNYSTQMMKSWFKETRPAFSLLFATPEAADAAVEEYKEAMKGDGKVLAERVNLQPQPQISLTVEDQHTGHVVAIVGGRGEKKANLTLNRAYDVVRQPGSTFKIVSTFAPALDSGQFTLASTQEDAPFQYESGMNVRNWYGEAYRGLSSIRTAIQNSMNVVTVKTLTDITPEFGYEYLLDFGFTSLVRREEIGGQIFSDIQQTMALGGLTKGVSNFELNASYATIANGGEYLEPKFYSKVTDHDGNVILDSNQQKKRRVLKETTAWLLTSAMEDVVTKGTGTRVNFGTTPIAGKTGTTSDNNDVWFAGYTNYYTATTWTGYDENTNLNGIETGYAKTLWRAVMSRIHEGLPASEFPMPDGIVKASVCSKSGKLPVPGLCNASIITDYFDKDTVPTENCDVHYKGFICALSGLPASDDCPFKTEGTAVFGESGLMCPHTHEYMSQDDIEEILAGEREELAKRQEEALRIKEQEKAKRDPYQAAVDAATNNLTTVAGILKDAQDHLVAAQQAGDAPEIQRWQEAVNAATASYQQAVQEQAAAVAVQQSAQQATNAQGDGN